LLRVPRIDGKIIISALHPYDKIFILLGPHPSQIGYFLKLPDERFVIFKAGPGVDLLALAHPSANRRLAAHLWLARLWAAHL
jgi:hypothetical protein